MFRSLSAQTLLYTFIIIKHILINLTSFEGTAEPNLKLYT